MDGLNFLKVGTTHDAAVCLVALPFHSINTQGTKRTGAYYVQSDFYDYRLRWSTVMTIAMTTTITMPAAWALAL